ncbi:betaine-homocysteine S-methyltransferase-like [Haematobia irritans]|uniref:betaine-homocysteine S-methyltransferase-like n=1 Tax=Haematobia irritans TaxID=7368 RepID=UPI003F50D2F3
MAEIKKQVLVKSGGFSTQLSKYVTGKIDGDPLWGSRFDLEDPSAVIRTHLDFLENGAQIILTNTYQSSVEGFMKHLNLSREQSMELIKKSCALAKEARDQYIKKIQTSEGVIEPILILGSVGPYGAVLNDGSEYDGGYASKMSKIDMKQFHRVRIEALLEGGVDGLAVETMPCQMEAEAITEMLLSEYPGIKFWISFQCKDDLHIANGDNFANACIKIWNLIKENCGPSRSIDDTFFGIGVNCVNPKIVTKLLKSVHSKGFGQPPFIVYSNKGEIFDAERGWIGQDKCVPIATFVPEWISLGARIIGGCCRVYPDDILEIRKCVENYIS